MTNIKKLAEFAPRFLLGVKYKDNERPIYFIHKNYFIPIVPENLFENLETAPILAHLAKKELAKRKRHWYSSWKWDKHNEKGIYFFQVIKDSSDPKLIMETDENEFIALWTAIFETGEKG